jgi:hypothetical protein
MTEKPSKPVTEGDLIIIACETDSANPAANIQFHRKRAGGVWEKITSGVTSINRDGEYHGKIRIGVLTLPAAMEDNMAEFECKAEKAAIRIGDRTNITVYCKLT